MLLLSTLDTTLKLIKNTDTALQLFRHRTYQDSSAAGQQRWKPDDPGHHQALCYLIATVGSNDAKNYLGIDSDITAQDAETGESQDADPADGQEAPQAMETGDVSGRVTRSLTQAATQTRHQAETARPMDRFSAAIASKQSKELRNTSSRGEGSQ